MAIAAKFYETPNLFLEIPDNKKLRRFPFYSHIEGVAFIIYVNTRDNTASLYFTPDSEILISEAAEIFHDFMKDNALGIKAIDTRKSWLNKNTINERFLGGDRKKYLRCEFKNDPRWFLITDEEYRDFMNSGIDVRIISTDDMPIMIDGSFDIQATYNDDDFRHMNSFINFSENPESLKDSTLFVRSGRETKLTVRLSGDDRKSPIFPRVKTEDGNGNVEIFIFVENDYAGAKHIDFSNIGDEVSIISRRVIGRKWEDADRVRKSLETFKNKEVKVSYNLYKDLMSTINYEKYLKLNSNDDLYYRGEYVDREPVSIKKVLKEFDYVDQIGLEAMKKRNDEADHAHTDEILSHISTMNMMRREL